MSGREIERGCSCSLITCPCRLSSACRITLTCDSFAFRGEFLDPFTNNFGSHFRAREERSEDSPHRVLSQDEADTSEDSSPRNKCSDPR